MSDKYSDNLPRFGRNRYRREDQGVARFDEFIRRARRLRSQPRSRPGLKIFAMAVIIAGLAYGVTERKNMLRLLGSQDKGIETVLPLSVSLHPPMAWSQAEVDATVVRVRPKVGKCISGWPASAAGRGETYRVEIVLTRDGPVEASMSGAASVPPMVSRCVGEVLGNARWPAPKWLRKVRFETVPVVPSAG